MEKGSGFRRIAIAALAAGAALASGVTAAAQQSVADLAQEEAKRLMFDPQMGRHQYRGGKGTKAVKRAAVKSRNVARNRAAHRRTHA